MEKKRVKYVRVLVNQKEDRKQKSFLEKYKDRIGTIASLCAIATVFITVIMTVMRDGNSDFAEEFYHIDKTYFLQESVIAKLFEASGYIILRLMVVFFPMVAFILAPCIHNISNIVEKIIICFIFGLAHVTLFIIYLFSCFAIVFNEVKMDIFNHTISKFCGIITILIICLIWDIFLQRNKNIQTKHKSIFIGIMTVSLIILYIAVGILWTERQILKYVITTYLFLGYYLLFCLRAEYRSEKNNSIREYHETSVMIVFFILVMLPLLWFSIIGMTKNPYMDKRDYELVQIISASNLEKIEEKTKSDSIYQTERGDAEYNYRNEQNKDESPFQVVILHRGSQVLLMNGKIDGNETINPQEDMSSSNLVIDTRSYEFQEASQYRFYRKEFKNVTTNALRNNDKQGE
jgi:membrane protein